MVLCFASWVAPQPHNKHEPSRLHKYTVQYQNITACMCACVPVCGCMSCCPSECVSVCKYHPHFEQHECHQFQLNIKFRKPRTPVIKNRIVKDHRMSLKSSTPTVSVNWPSNHACVIKFHMKYPECICVCVCPCVSQYLYVCLCLCVCVLSMGWHTPT